LIHLSGSPAKELFKVSIEAASQSRACFGCRGSPGKHNDIDGRCLSTLPERLSGDALDAIAIDRAPRRFAGNGESETSAWLGTRACEDCKELIGGSAGISHDAAEIARSQQSLPASEALRARRP
jgi:hypothetical protein